MSEHVIFPDAGDGHGVRDAGVNGVDDVPGNEQANGPALSDRARRRGSR